MSCRAGARQDNSKAKIDNSSELPSCSKTFTSTLWLFISPLYQQNHFNYDTRSNFSNRK